jgi:protein gp37
MSDKSKIEWTDATWNPVRGCTKISPGCAHCYAETFAERFRGVKGHPWEHGFDVRECLEMLDQPLRWTKPRKIFVNSMSDLFHSLVSRSFIERVCEVMYDTASHHTYQILTKRPERLLNLSVMSSQTRTAALRPNIWWGVSVEDKVHGIPRIKVLQDSILRNRFLSIEPLLEDLGTLDLRGIGWVIVGGESGPGARPMHPAWVRSIRDQCKAAGVPFFFKQWGTWCPFTQTERTLPFKAAYGYKTNTHFWRDGDHPQACSIRMGKKDAGSLLDGQAHKAFPEGMA